MFVDDTAVLQLDKRHRSGRGIRRRGVATVGCNGNAIRTAIEFNHSWFLWLCFRSTWPSRAYQQSAQPQWHESRQQKTTFHPKIPFAIEAIWYSANPSLATVIL